MPCVHVKLPGGVTAIVRVAKQRPRKCSFCESRKARHECDICDKPICNQHRTHFPGDRDYCPDHLAEGRNGQ